MQNEFSREDLEKLFRDAEDFVRRLAKDLSVARLLAENEPIGDLVILSLCDDGLVKSDLLARLKMISDWLKTTEDLYEKQFPEGFPKKDRRYDLTTPPPPGFKTRIDILVVA
jgi:hypothetical protein